MTVEAVLGLGFGDEGKGSLVDWLGRRAIADGARQLVVVRWNGGPQAQHHVVTDDGRVHCFAQLGAASFAGARTHLAGDMAVDLFALQQERAAFAAVSGLLPAVTVDPRCPLVTPWHAAVNLVRETARGAARHGTTGRGVGEAKLGPIQMHAGELAYDFAARTREVRAALLARASAFATTDETRAIVARAASSDVLDSYLDTAPVALSAELPPADHVILESAQGALLDRDHGFFPHVTPSRITRRAARDVARSLGLRAFTTWGVLRAYHTRHGEGPFPSEAPLPLPELHNPDDGPAGRFRVGWFDAVLARYALAFAGPIDHLAVTCLDRVAALPARAIVTRYASSFDPEHLGAAIATPVDDLATAISAALDRRIDLRSFGPRAKDKVSSR